MISDFIYGILGLFGISKPEEEDDSHDTPSRMEEAVSPHASREEIWNNDDDDDQGDEDDMDDLDFMV